MTDNTQTTDNTKTLGFQTEIKQLLHLVVHSLYSNQEIFLRELISNASDAADKLRFEALKDDGLYEDDSDLKIRVEYDKKLKTITVLDNGIGMSYQEVIDNIGTIAKSGTKEFFQKLTGDQAKDSQLIGQFGLGFYSVFTVASHVEVLTRRAGLARTEGVKWCCDGDSEYTIQPIDRAKRGTRITLTLKDGRDEFLDGFRLRGVIKKYSDHINLPIYMNKEGEEETGEEMVNEAIALWARTKKDIKAKEYHEFYKHISYDYEEPLDYSHNKVEGKLNYTSLLYIPSKSPFDLWDRDHPHGVKLYVHRVFIMDDAKQLLPLWLRFIRGIVDSDDLPLNVSREILQHNKTISVIRTACIKRVLAMLKKMAEKKPEQYQTFWGVFGKVVKEGVVETPEYKEELSELFRFTSTHEYNEEQTISLQDYVGRMKDEQNSIYYLTAANYIQAKNSSYIEIFRKKDIEVLLLTDPIDEWVTAHLAEYQGKPLKSVAKGDLDLTEDKDKDDKPAKADDDVEEFIKRIQEVLGDKVKSVRETKRLVNSPACLVSDEGDMGRYLTEILKASGQSATQSKPILEINLEHAMVAHIKAETDQAKFSDWVHILYDQSLLSEGGQLEDPTSFINRLNTLMMQMIQS